MSDTSSRLLGLLSLLQGRRDLRGTELAERLEVSGRTLRRDIERLRQLGYPVESLTGPAGRLDRLSQPASTGVRFVPRKLPAKDAAAYVKQSITTAPNRFEAVVTLHAPADDLTTRVPAHWGAIEPIDAHTCRYTTGDDDLRWLAWRIAMLGVDFEVHEPPELIEHLRALAARLTRAAR
jgi:predicted DNA-binding transcriptional regulator YafY